MEKINSCCLEEAIRIGEDILTRKQEHKKGFCWKTMSLDSSNNIRWEVSESIYSGVGGIILFLLELYKQTLDQRYLETAVKGADWLIDYTKNNPTSYYAFYTGRMGLSYVLTEVHRVSDEQKYIQEAIRNAQHCTDFFKHPGLVDDLINGTSGTLLGLLKLHHETGEEKLLPLLDKFAGHLIQNVHHGPKGLYWDKNVRQMRGLCGFSHGTAGVGYVFLQLGFYFSNPTFYWLAEQAFLYENHFFDKQTENWPDFRKAIFTNEDFEEHKQAYISQNRGFFFKPGYIKAWCHGAPGIGLSRVHGWQLLNKDYLKKDLEIAMLSTKKNIISSLSKNDTFTLCHGKGGNAFLFLEAYKKLGYEKGKVWAQQVAQQALKSRETFGAYASGFPTATIDSEDTSLFMGTAGIGYFYLMCINPENTPSILSPAVNNVCKEKISSFDTLNINPLIIQKKVLKEVYPRTVNKISHFQLQEEEPFFCLEHTGSADIKSIFKNYICHLTKNEKNPQTEKFRNVFNLEKKKLEISLLSNPAFQNIKSILLNEESQNLLTLSKENLMNTVLSLNHDITIIKNRNLITNFEENQQEYSNQQSVVLYCSPEGVDEFRVSDFTQEILDAFAKPKKVCDVKDQLFSEYALENNVNKLKFEDLVLDQVKECIRSLFLIAT